MKKLLFSLLALSMLVSSTTFAQRKCGSYEHFQEMLQNSSQFAIERQLIETQTENYVNNPSLHSRAIVTIPVVFHIVYNTTTQNVSDAQIQSQLTVLNADYRKLNADWSNTPSFFQSLVADCEIQFCLAQQTPTGAATTGIIRKSTTTTSFSTNDAVKYSAQGGDDIWDRNKYLNIWVCNIGGGILGYAQFPGGAAATDGVVINYTALGNTGTAAAPYNKGRTATHEIGHWLNLNHIWGDDGTACTGTDNVGDTPNQAGENYGCPTFPHVSCSNGPNGDMFMNYMDYTDDACMYMFSAGQKARMQALFATGGARVSLLTSLGCNAPSTGTTCGDASGLTAASITTTGATLSWGAASNATSYNVQYKTSVATTWTTLSTTLTSTTLSGLTAGTLYNFQVQAVCASGTGTYVTSTFTTSTATSTTCSNNYESNNTVATATSIAINTNITSMVGTSTDKDYYKIVTTTAAPKLKVTLTGLPADYDLKLYKSNGSTVLGSSVNGGTTSETITYNSATAGATYYIYIYGYNGAYSTTSCYSLNATTSATNLKEEATNLIETKPSISIYPNPAFDKINITYFEEANQEVIANIYNTIGQKIVSQQSTTVEGENKLSFDVNNLSKGVYILEMITNNERKVQKFTIEK